MSSKWTFIGGILAGIAGVFTAAAISWNWRVGKAAVAMPWMSLLALPESEGM